MPCLFTKGHRYAVAFSGGLDSTLLLHIGHQMLGDGVVALLGVGVNFPRDEQREAEEFCRREKIHLVKVPFDFNSVPEFVENSRERCYYCKRALFALLKAKAEQLGAELVDGTNLSDVKDFRPGRRAAEKLGVQSPFLQAGMGKEEIRTLAGQLGLGVVKKPSMACLASRVPYGRRITGDLLRRIDEAETCIRKAGYYQVRVRVLSEEELRLELEPLPKEGTEYIQNTARSIFPTVKTVNLARYTTGFMNDL